eukprot:4732352-Amphidinium_carterae.1
MGPHSGETMGCSDQYCNASETLDSRGEYCGVESMVMRSLHDALDLGEGRMRFNEKEHVCISRPDPILFGLPSAQVCKLKTAGVRGIAVRSSHHS